MSVLQLYSDFAERYELAECKLAIVHCAGHYDPSLIDALWQNILDQGIVHFILYTYLINRLAKRL